MNFARVTVPGWRQRSGPALTAAQASAIRHGRGIRRLIPVAPTGVPVLDEPRKGSGANNYNHLVYARAGRMLLRDDLRAIALAPGAVLSGWGLPGCSSFVLRRSGPSWRKIASTSSVGRTVGPRRGPRGSFAGPGPRPTEVYLTLLAGFTAVFAARL